MHGLPLFHVHGLVLGVLRAQVVAYVVADAATEVQLIDFVAGQLSAHKRPRQVHLVEHLPRNAMGKIQKTLLAGG